MLLVKCLAFCSWMVSGTVAALETGRCFSARSSEARVVHGICAVLGAVLCFGSAKLLMSNERRVRLLTPHPPQHPFKMVAYRHKQLQKIKQSWIVFYEKLEEVHSHISEVQRLWEDRENGPSGVVQLLSSFEDKSKGHRVAAKSTPLFDGILVADVILKDLQSKKNSFEPLQRSLQEEITMLKEDQALLKIACARPEYTHAVYTFAEKAFLSHIPGKIANLDRVVDRLNSFSKVVDSLVAGHTARKKELTKYKTVSFAFFATDQKEIKSEMAYLNEILI